MRESPYLQAVHNVLHGAGLPYGYAVTVWTTGAVLTGQQGVPSLLEVYLLAAGAVGGYGGLRLLTWETESEADRPLTRSPRRVRAGLIHVGAIALAISSAALVAEIASSVVWLLAPFSATLLYFGISSVEVALVEAELKASEAGS